MNSKRKLALLFVLATAPALALAQDHGSGGGGGGHGSAGGGGCGDVLGDLIHILRHPDTGQPILQKRFIEEKGAIITGYCPIAVNAAGEEIGFADDLDLSCDAADAEAVVEVDYFGRLSGGRTKERNGRMHFDEVISTIKDKAVGWVGVDETGRMQLGYECDGNVGKRNKCTEFRLIDSPMENMALYTRLMKYGHFQTDPDELDAFSHGDPAVEVFHPALNSADKAKFDKKFIHVLAGNGAPCFDSQENFIPACADGESLDEKDFAAAAAFLSGAASKTGKITVDLVQYMNRILKITQDTEMSAANKDTLPALIRDCGGEIVYGAEDEVIAVNYGDCAAPVSAELVAGAPQERFVNFGQASYKRGQTWNPRMANLLQNEEGGGTWFTYQNFKIVDWLCFADPIDACASDELSGEDAITNIDGFVQATSDALRAIEFVHNYAIPDDLWLLYAELNE